MEMQNMLIFALIGAICALVITGGLLSMNDTEPTTGGLTVGAVVGAAIGTAASYFTDGSTPGADTIMSAIGVGPSHDMKVGLPNF